MKQAYLLIDICRHGNNLMQATSCHNYLQKKAIYIVIILLSLPFPIMSQNISKQSEKTQNPIGGVLTQIVSSPVLLENNMVKFNLYAPSAHEVAVTGEWMKGFGAISLDGGKMKEGPMIFSEQIYYSKLLNLKSEL
jgi:hypothetical protein